MWNVLRFISIILSYLPEFLFKFLWRILDIFEGKVGAILRYILIAKKLKNCGDRVFFGPYVHIESIGKLKLGNNVSIHHQCTLICAGEIELGDNVAIAHNSSLVSTNHTWDNIEVPIKYNPITKSKIVIEKDVWIGCSVKILAGTHIEPRVVVAAGAVVSGKRLAGNSIYGGVPCKKLKMI
ncbi:acyltransferase [Acinetobacter haemolyticus]|uniref:acyltransferase n=1 Tax=Acinetobacter haemolyticus TaxID=29430 RepID=UPI003F579810